MQEVRVHNLPRQIAPEELAGSTVVVIDLLRATSTICQALAAGAAGVVPFLEIEEALAAAKDRANVVLGGERHGKLIDGFDLGNSPSEYTPELDHARDARRVLTGSFLNLSALVESLRNDARVDILCAGTDGVESREDILAAGAIVEKLVAEERGNWKVDARAGEALAEWQARGAVLAVELRDTPGGRNLLEIGMDHDLVDCARIDALTVVPVLDIPAWQITAS
jgi:2-phosphosulfolactate phosphatase